MANKTIPQLPAAPAALLSNRFEIDNGGASQGITLTQIKALLNPSFTSAQLTLNATSWSVAHGLGVTPKLVKLVLVCVVNDANSGYTVGDELAVEDFMCPNIPAPFSYGANSTNLFAATPVAAPVGNELGYTIAGQSGGGSTSPSSFNNFRFKFYAIP